MKIVGVYANEIFNSYGIPTVECIIALSNGHTVRASVPTGISCSGYEATDLRDGGDRLAGLGVRGAVHVIEHTIAPLLVGKEPHLIECDMALIERDGTTNKSVLGGNSTLAVSIAIARAHAYIEQVSLYELIAHICGLGSVSLPGPMFNIISGGAHATSSIPIQEFLIIPLRSKTFRAAVEICFEIYREVRQQLIDRKMGGVGVSTEGASIITNGSIEELFELITEIINLVVSRSGYPGMVMIGVDMAATQLYDKSADCYYLGQQNKMNARALAEWYSTIIHKYPIYLIEDPFHEDDMTGWGYAMDELRNKIHLIADDMTATSVDRIASIQEHIRLDGCVIKPNQAGTVTEALYFAKYCRENNDMHTVVSHRSMETNDSFIADLSVGINAHQIKAGNLCRGERIAKYNRLLEIENQLIKLSS